MRSMIRIILVSFSVLMSAAANAALIEGNMTISGGYSPTMLDINDLTTVTKIKLGDVAPSGSTLDYASTINFFTPDGSGSGSATLGLFVPVSDFFTFAGWTLNLTSLLVESDTSATFLHLSGNGLVSGNAFDPTDVTWSFSASNNSIYSMSVTSVAVVPVPAAVWLFGSGLIGLVGVARRKA